MRLDREGVFDRLSRRDAVEREEDLTFPGGELPPIVSGGDKKPAKPKPEPKPKGPKPKAAGDYKRPSLDLLRAGTGDKTAGRPTDEEKPCIFPQE